MAINRKKICKECGKKFVPDKNLIHKNKRGISVYIYGKYCSYNCKNIPLKEKNNPIIKVKCDYCGKQFEKRKNNSVRIYCEECCDSKKRQEIYANKHNPWVIKKCEICNDEFKVRKSNQIKKYCSKKECRRISMRPLNNKYNAKKLLDEHMVENEYSKQKYKYYNNIVSYNLSPTKKAYIGLAKKPLMENDNKIGFKGVKVQSENRRLIQCNECGKWYQMITSTHLKQHGLTMKHYKEKYGYNKNTSLVADEHSNYLANQMVNNVNKVGKRPSYESVRKNLEKGRIKYIKERKKNNTGPSMEKMNLHGTCPEQLKARFINHINRFRRIPSSPNGMDGFGALNTLKKRFGNLNNVLKEYGLPTKIQLARGMAEYKFQDNTLFYVKHGKGYEELYYMMKAKCKVLNEY
jgi:predicted transcriptional regulator/endogenous inhibitor of DNA gyrase (YacG/DUF329 family)